MRKIVLTVVALSALVFTSCTDEETPEVLLPVEAKTVTNLHAPQVTNYSVNPPATTGDFAKFSFKTGGKVSGDDWDIAFRGTTILINGGAEIGNLSDEPTKTGDAALAMVSDSFAGVTEAPNAIDFKQDASGSYALPTGSGNGWYTYAGPPTHLINPIAGKVIVVRTMDGHYAKMEILSYYKDNTPARDTSRYYTFNYIYNPNQGDKNLQ